MGVLRSNKPAYIDEMRKGGVATQDELDAHQNNNLIHLPEPDSSNNKMIPRYDDSSKSIVWTKQAELETVALPYYYDSSRNKYLSNETMVALFYKGGTGLHNTALYHVSDISSYTIPFKLFNSDHDYCIIWYDMHTTNDVEGDRLIKVVRRDTKDELFAAGISPKGSDSHEDLDIEIPGDVGISATILDTKLNNPYISVGLKLIYNPQ